MAPKKPVSNDPAVPTPERDVPATPPASKESVAPLTPTGEQTADPVQEAVQDVQAATREDGTVDPQAAAIAGQGRREAQEAAKRTPVNAAGVVPTGAITRQLEDGTPTDRRTGAAADKSLAGENLPVLKPGEPDPRQGVTTGDLTNPGAPEGEDTETVTFRIGYHLYNRGEQATFSRTEAQRLRDLGVVE